MGRVSNMKQAKALHSLVDFLQRNFPRDVVMPVEKGKKHPLFKHVDGSWTWAALHRFMRDNQKRLADFDFCVLLHDLCVVDVDNMDLVTDLTARFPLLNEVPAATTAKGMHFWFVRPEEAEAMGYFDGAAQRRQGVDYKSICSSGTGGVVMVPPSTNKAWRRTGLSEGVSTMPLDLLDEVAAPRHRAVEVRLRFTDGQEAQLRTRCIHAMTYFEPFLAEDDEGVLSADDCIPVPCERHAFEQLVHVLDKGCVSTAEPTPALFARMAEVLGMLGGPAELLSRLQCGIPRFQLDWANVDGRAWQAAFQERSWLAEGAAQHADLVMVDVNAQLAATLRYEPLVQDQRWLFRGGAGSDMDCERGDPVLFADPVTMLSDAMDCMCPPLARLLQRYRGRLVLAGGSVLGCVSGYVAPGSDWDLFVVGMNGEEADAMLQEVEQAIAPIKTVHTSRAVTFVAGNKHAPVTVQVVRRLYANAAQVVSGFDFAPCRVAAWWDGTSCDLVVRAMPSWVVCMQRLAFPVELERWSSTTAARVLKYVAKGFDAYLPGLRRAAVKPFNDSEPKDGSLSRLLWVERDVLRARRHTGQTCRLTLEEVRHYTCRCCTSDYGTMAKLRGNMWYILQNMLRKGKEFLWNQTQTQAQAQAQRGWAVFDPLKKNSGIFQPMSPRLYGAMCRNRLQELLLTCDV